MGAKSWLVGALVVGGVAWFVVWQRTGLLPLPPQSVSAAVPAEVPTEGASSDSLPAGRELRAEAATQPPATDGALATDVRVELHGWVRVHDDGPPIPGASLTVWNATARADEEGRYELAFAWQPNPAEPMVLQVAAEGFRTAMVPVHLREPGRAQLDIALTPVRHLSVQVVDRTTRLPIAGAEVRLGGRGPNSDDSRRTTDDEGRVELELQDGLLRITAADHCPAYWSRPSVELREVQVSLLGLGYIEGTVRDRAGLAVRGAFVDHSSEQRPVLGEPASGTRPAGLLVDVPPDWTVRSGADGSFRIGVCPGPDPQTLRVDRHGYVSCRSRPFVLAVPGERQRLDFVLSEAGSVRGTVRCNGEPLPCIVEWRIGDAGDSTGTDQGSYLLQDVPPGSVEITVRRASSATAAQSRVVPVVAGREQRCDFDWQEEIVRLTGRVTNQRGEPVPDAIVSAVEETGFSDGRSVGAKCDAGGKFSIEVGWPGSSMLAALHGGGQTLRRGVASDAQGVELVLPDTRSVRLRIREADTRRPVVGHGRESMILWRPTGERAFLAAKADMDLHGVAEAELPVGVLDLQIAMQRRGYAPFLLPAVTIGEGTGEIPIDLHRGATVRLLARGDEPVSVAQVGHQLFLLEVAQEASLRGAVSSVGYATGGARGGVEAHCTDPAVLQQALHFSSDGRSVVRGLAPGRYRLVVFPDDLVFEPATFEVGPTGADVELTWRRR